MQTSFIHRMRMQMASWIVVCKKSEISNDQKTCTHKSILKLHALNNNDNS